MLNKIVRLVAVLLLFGVVFSFSLVSAITGSIGNARMILNANEGDVIDKTILVINVNDVPVKIELSASGDLADNLEIIDSNFTLQPDEELKARIKITVAKSGTTETSVNVKFTPLDGKNGVGLSSKIIVNAKETSFWDFLNGDENSEQTITGNVVEDNQKSSGLMVVVILSVVFLALLLVLIFVGFRKNKHQKGVDRSL